MSIEKMRKLAENRGGRCLSDTVHNNRTMLLWECAYGHQWQAVVTSVKKGTWCPRCSYELRGKSRRLTIEEMQRLAQDRGGRCLSASYVNAHTKLLWQCAEGHKWEAKPDNIKSGKWCPRCYGNQRLTINDAIDIAKNRNGICLSETYVNSTTKLLWECAEGHRWESTLTGIKRGHWCPKCAKKEKLTIEEMHGLAHIRGGKCISDHYRNGKTKLLWECSEGHRWEAGATNVKRGSWCPYCAQNQNLTIEEMHKIAGNRGGRCISENYVSMHVKLSWECAEGHSWEAVPANIKNGRWCPTCSDGLGERICRTFFEQLFAEPFPKSYPKWLLNDRRNQMELDGYCEKLNVAFEHHGKQHYQYNKFFHTTSHGFTLRQTDDIRRRAICDSKRIVLIEIPELTTMLPVDELRNFVVAECKRKGVRLPDDYENKAINLNQAYSTAGAKVYHEELKKIATERGGKCLSERYENNTRKLLWECSYRHQWEAAPTSVKGGSWCPICAGNVKLTIEEMQRLAQERGGKCLSTSYKNGKKKLLWECADGHQWEAVPQVIIRGMWCPKCAGNARLTIVEMQEIASKRGGACLSATYINSTTKLLWECAKGHHWEAVPSSIVSGSWCPFCAGIHKLTIEEMQNIAEERGGRCLSTTYVNARTSLLWQCADGHQWEARPDNIKNGKWCPVCYRNRRPSVTK